MDTRRLIVGMSLAMAVMVGWQLMVGYLDKKYPQWGLRSPTTTQPVTPTSAPPATPAPGPSGPPAFAPAGTQASTTPVIVPPAVATPTIPTATAPTAPMAVAATQPVTSVRIGSITKNDPTYALAIDLSPVGAAIDAITLNQFKTSVNKPDLYVFQQPMAGGTQTRALATRWLTVDGVKVDLDRVTWTPTASTPGSATFILDLNDAAGVPTLRLTKTYTLTDRTTEAANAAGYEVKVDQALQNLSNRPLNVTTAFNGTVAPANENDRMPDQQVVTGYLKQGYVVLDQRLVTTFRTPEPRDLTTHKDGLPMAWVGMGSGYFNAVLRPEAATGALSTGYVARVTATPLKPEAKDYHHDVQLLLETQPVALQPAGLVNMPMRAFFMPKQRALLSHAYLQAPPLSFEQTLVQQSWCSICTFQWLVSFLVWLLGIFHAIFFDWGLAIIALVCVVRTILHPITKKSQVNMMKMGKMGPELERLKLKYKDDKEGLNRAMVQFYKEQGATPILGCLPMFLQMPIWIALYTALQTTFELRQSPFLQFGGLKMTWIEDLAHPDRLFYFPDKAINLYFFHVDAFNVLPFLLAIVFWLQTKYTPKPPATTPEQKQQQQMMQWMTLLFPVFLYNGPAGLNLYILTSTTIGIIESKIIRRHIKEREQAEAKGVVIVDARRDDDDLPPRGGVRRVEPKKPQGGLGAWFASLQQKAEDLRRDADRKQGRK
jgi:YidC/Oxa1 family membrane protein insertase